VWANEPGKYKTTCLCLLHQSDIHLLLLRVAKQHAGRISPPAMSLAMTVSSLHGVSSQFNTRYSARADIRRNQNSPIPPTSSSQPWRFLTRRQSSKLGRSLAHRSWQSLSSRKLLRPTDVLYTGSLAICKSTLWLFACIRHGTRLCIILVLT